MGNTFEVWNWEQFKWGVKYRWVQHYAGESKDEAFAKLEELKSLGAGCVKLEWR